MKKFISIILAIIMTFTVIPCTVFATEDKPAIKYDGGSWWEASLEENSYNYVKDDTTELTAGWWVVYKDTTTTNLTCNGAVNLLILDGATLTANGEDGYAGINVTGNNSLTIYGQKNQKGIINAYGGDKAAGIGGNENQICAHTTVKGTTINAYGGTGGAGIGNGYIDTMKGSYTMEQIVINYGIINAYGGNGASGIGDGDLGNMTKKMMEQGVYAATSIIINGGLINAYGSYNDDSESVGIGGYVAKIYINGGNINAVGGSNAVGVGCLSMGTSRSTGSEHSAQWTSEMYFDAEETDDYHIVAYRSSDGTDWYYYGSGSGEDNIMSNYCGLNEKLKYMHIYCEETTYHKHEFAVLSYTPATCTDNSKEVYMCTDKNCCYIEERTTGATGHLFIDYVYNNDETCTTNGTETAKCLYCDATDTREVEGTAFGHVEGMTTYVDTKVATCTEDGIRTEIVYCTCCGEELSRHSRYLSALGHNTTIINQKEATEDEYGYTGDTYCKACKQILEYGKVIEKLEPTTEETTVEETTETEETTVVEDTTIEDTTIEDTTIAEETTENTSSEKKSTSIFDMIIMIVKKIVNFIKNLF